MSKLESKFEELLHNIEPDESAVKYAKKAHEPIRAHLSADKEFKDCFVDSFLYGSYRRHTAIDNIKDVDIVILTNFTEKDKPNEVLKKLKAALARYYKDPENPEYQRRSIRINDPLPDSDTEMTLDIIPAIIITDDEAPLKVPDREVGEWIWSHPKGHIEHSSALNAEDYSDGRFVPLVKIMKWWWQYQCEQNQPNVKRPKPKGFWLESLTAENFDRTKDNYAEHFIVVLQNIYLKYKDQKNVPELKDPGLENETIKTSMNKTEFSKFMKVLKGSLDLALSALALDDDAESSEEWRKIFGPKFPLIRRSTNSSTVKREGPVISTKPEPWIKKAVN